MSQNADAWYVRLPDGRVLRASSTNAVRHHLASGRIPLDSRVRRSPDDEWVMLEWATEFADVVRELTQTRLAAAAAIEEPVSNAPSAPDAGSIASRLEAMQLRTVGVRGFFEELLAALDSTLVQAKLLLAGALGLLCGAVLALAWTAAYFLTYPWDLAAWLAGGVSLLLGAALTNSLITQLTYIELSRLRSAQWAEAAAGLGRATVNLFLIYVVVVGVLGGAIVLLRWLPANLVDLTNLEAQADARVLVADLIWVLALLLEVLLWPMLALCLVLAPIVIVEECAAWTALRLWLALLRQYVTRILVYEALTAIFGLVTCLPLAVPVALAALGSHMRGPAGIPVTLTLCVLVGLSLAPLFAYVMVANVFIYLNLRYEQAPRRR